MSIEKLPIKNRKQPGTQIALGTFAIPIRQRPLKTGLHQIVGTAGVARQRYGETPQPGNDFTQLSVDVVHGKGVFSGCDEWH